MHLDIYLQPKNNKRQWLITVDISAALLDWINKNVISIKRIADIESAMHNYISNPAFECMQPYKYYPIQKNEFLAFIEQYRNDTAKDEEQYLQPEELSDRVTPDFYSEAEDEEAKIKDKENNIKALTDIITTTDWNENSVLISEGVVFY